MSHGYTPSEPYPDRLPAPRDPGPAGSAGPAEGPRLRKWDEHLAAIAGVIAQWERRDMSDDLAARTIAAYLKDRDEVRSTPADDQEATP